MREVCCGNQISEENSRAGDHIMVESPRFWGVHNSDTCDSCYNNRVFQVISRRNTGLIQSNLASKNKCCFSQLLLAQQNCTVPQNRKREFCSWWKLDKDMSLHMLEVTEWQKQHSVGLRRSASPPSGRYEVSSITLHGDTTGSELKTKPSDWNVSW